MPRTLRVILASLFGIGLIAGTIFVTRSVSRSRRLAKIAPLMASAHAAVQRADFSTARTTAEQALTFDERHPGANLLLGWLAFRDQSLDEALRYLDRVPEATIRLGAEARFLEGRVFLLRHDAVAAERAFLRAAELDPASVSAQEALLDLYSLQMRLGPTRERVRMLARLRPLGLGQLFRDLAAGEPFIERAASIDTLSAYARGNPHDSESRLALVRCYLALPSAAEAARILEPLRSDRPSDSRVRGLVVETCLEGDRIDDAAQELARVQVGEPADLLLWKALASYWSLVGEDDRAIEAYESALIIHPADAVANYKLGMLLRQTGRSDDADIPLQRAELVNRLREESRNLADRTGSKEAVAAYLLEVGERFARVGLSSQARLWLETALRIDPARQSARDAIDRLPDEPDAATSIPPVLTARLTPSGEPTNESAGASFSASTGIRFADRHDELGLDFRYFSGESGFKWLVETLGGGAAVIDYDDDGWPDLFFPQGNQLPAGDADAALKDRLFRNVGGSGFRDVSMSAGVGDTGYALGATSSDFDNDGDADLYVTRYGRNILYRNHGDGTFEDVTDSASTVREAMSSSAAFADLDGDGALDLYVVNYLDRVARCVTPAGKVIACEPARFNAEQDFLYANDGQGGFVDVTDSSGIVVPDGKGLGIVVADFDDDHRPEIYVANDGTPNFLFRNRSGRTEAGAGDFAFDQVGFESGTAVNSQGIPEAGMGIACADLDNDGLLDLYVTNYYRQTNTLYLNGPGLQFRDGTGAAALAAPTLPVLGFGTQSLDADADGLPDLFVANGHIDDLSEVNIPWKMRPQFFANRGDGRFADRSNECGDYFAGSYLGRGCATLDWNRDGRADLVVVHQDRAAALLENQTPMGSRTIAVDLVGTRSNRDAINARIRCEVDGAARVFEVTGGNGYLVSNDRRVLIAAGTAPHVDLRIDWPSGQVDEAREVAVGSALLAIEGTAPIVMRPASGGPAPAREVNRPVR